MRTRTLAVTFVVAATLILGVSATPVQAHSQLVSSSPGAATVLATSPTELRLVFSEPLEARFTELQVSDRDGLPVAVPDGALDPADAHTWVVPLATPLPDGLYTVDWRAMSAADGHGTAGFFTFGVGSAILPRGGTSGSGAGEIHTGHDLGPAVVEVAGSALGYLGFMLAFGLFVFGAVVLGPATGPAGTPGPAEPSPADPATPTAGRRRRRSPTPSAKLSSSGKLTPSAKPPASGKPAASGQRLASTGSPWAMLVSTQAVALLAGAVGGVILAFAAANDLHADLVGYLASTRSGNLVLAQLGVALCGAAAVALLLRTGRRAGNAAVVGGIAGFASLVLVALSGHASAFASPAPLAVMIVHMAAAAVWLAGLVALAWLAGSPERRDLLRTMVPRFSALALVSVALVALTGAAAAWAETRELLPFGTPYGLALAAKAVIFAVALGLGAANFFDGGRGRPTFGAMRGRLRAEAVVGAVVLLAAANLASGSPPGTERAVPIAHAPSTAAATLEIGLAFRPGRPGPNRFEVTLPGGLADERSVVLLLQRLDQNVGETRVELQRVVSTAAAGSEPAAGSPTSALFAADGGLLPPDSRWEASAVVLERDGSEVTRQRFTYAMDQAGIVEGRASLPLDPVVVIAFALLVAAVLGVSFAIGGGRLPRTDGAASRSALLAGGTAAGVLALALLVVGIGK